MKSVEKDRFFVINFFDFLINFFFLLSVFLPLKKPPKKGNTAPDSSDAVFFGKNHNCF